MKTPPLEVPAALLAPPHRVAVCIYCGRTVRRGGAISVEVSAGAWKCGRFMRSSCRALTQRQTPWIIPPSK